MTRSTPSMTSGFSVEAPARALNIFTGRRFVYRPSALRMPSRPCSGRGFSGSVVSHFGPPTAASSTASDAFAASSVSCGSAVPVASMAAPPSSASVYSNATSYFAPSTSSTFTASAMISGPMPSPGSRQIL